MGAEEHGLRGIPTHEPQAAAHNRLKFDAKEQQKEPFEQKAQHWAAECICM